MNNDDIEKKFLIELSHLKENLKAKNLCLELVRPNSKIGNRMVSDADIHCFGINELGEPVFEFNFSTSLRQVLADYLKQASISDGIRIWLRSDSQIEIEKITKGLIAEERLKFFEMQEQKYREAKEEWKKKLSTAPFGVDLANKVYEKLLQEPLCHFHRDYCGTGFFRREDAVAYCEFEDGQPTGETLAYFEDGHSFITWLSVQSDRSLARIEEESFKQGNQTVTKDRLVDFVKDIFR